MANKIGPITFLTILLFLFQRQQRGCQNWQQLVKAMRGCVTFGKDAWIFKRQGHISQVSTRGLTDLLSEVRFEYFNLSQKMRCLISFSFWTPHSLLRSIFFCQKSNLEKTNIFFQLQHFFLLEIFVQPSIICVYRANLARNWIYMPPEYDY